jgi:2-keto-4-pentenoate hydratase/2-oxohepta-3-ene-1,7-dioic acid hydratase in catechol pathway
MMKMSRLACLAPLALAACVFSPSDPSAAPPPSGDSIALARAPIDGATHLLLVTDDDGATIDAADLGPLTGPALGRAAARGIDGLLADAADAPRVRVPYAQLLPPVDADVPAIEVGANYPDPAGAASPFLFPNQAAPAPAVGAVAAAAGGAELLDHGVALCAVLGEPVAAAPAADTALRGFYLCQHLADRGAQLRAMDLDHPERPLGLTEAGRRLGYWRTGPYLYVPRDPAAYLARAELRLAVNGMFRQDAPVSVMRWSVAEVARQTLATGAAPSWIVDGAPARLYAGGPLPAGLSIVTGTPAGSLYRPPSESFIDDTRARYIFDAVYLTGVGFDTYAKDRYLAQERASGRYLRAGDRVEASGTFLGRLEVAIE